MKRSRIAIGVLACGIGAASVIGCNAPRRVSLINHGSATVKAAKLDHAGDEAAIVYMPGPSGGRLFLRDGESFQMGDARITLDGGQMLIASVGERTVTAQRVGFPERTLISPGSVGAYALSDEPIAIDGVEVAVRR